MKISSKYRILATLFSLLLILPAFAEVEPAPQADWQKAWQCERHHAEQFESSVCKIAMGANLKFQQDAGHSELDELIGVEMWAGMSPSPGTRSIVLYNNTRRWILEAFLYDNANVENGRALAIRHTRVGVSEARVTKFKRKTAKLRRQLENAPTVECYDGANLGIWIGDRQNAHIYSRTNCNDRTLIDDLSDEMMSLAIELDPGLASYADTMTLDLGP